MTEFIYEIKYLCEIYLNRDSVYSGGGHGNTLWNSYLEDLMDREAWRATVHSAIESDTSENTCMCIVVKSLTH